VHPFWFYYKNVIEKYNNLISVFQIQCSAFSMRINSCVLLLYTHRPTALRFEVIGAVKMHISRLLITTRHSLVPAFQRYQSSWSLLRNDSIHLPDSMVSPLAKFHSINVWMCTYVKAIYQHKYQINLSKPTGHVMHQQFNIQQLYVLPTLYLCVLYLSENKQRLVPLTA